MIIKLWKIFLLRDLYCLLHCWNVAILSLLSSLCFFLFVYFLVSFLWSFLSIFHVSLPYYSFLTFIHLPSLRLFLDFSSFYLYCVLPNFTLPLFNPSFHPPSRSHLSSFCLCYFPCFSFPSFLCPCLLPLFFLSCVLALFISFMLL